MKSIQDCKKISIVGPVGSGKSTLAKRLSELLDLPVFHLDHISDEDIDEAVMSDKWIIDGNRSESLAKRFRVADVIVWLNFPMEFCRESTIKRDPDLLIEIAFNIKDNTKTKKHIVPLAKQYKEKVLEFKTREQINDFTSGINKQKVPTKIRTLL